MTDDNHGSKTRFERFVDFARLMFRARATELGMSSERVIRERKDESGPSQASGKAGSAVQTDKEDRGEPD
jgi:hypothetical protein